MKTTELHAQDIQALLQLRATTKSLDSSSIRIDLAPYSHVHWLNNLEKVRQDKTRQEKKRKEKKRKEKNRETTPFGINSLRSQVLHWAA